MKNLSQLCRPYSLCLFIMLSGSLISCGDDDAKNEKEFKPESFTANISGTSVICATDEPCAFSITFQGAAENDGVVHYRLFYVKSLFAGQITTQDLAGLNDANYQRVSVRSDNVYNEIIDNDLLDYEGNPIQPGTDYYIYVATVVDFKGARMFVLSTPSDSIRLPENGEPDVSGSYIGEWNGNLGFEGVPVSAKINRVSAEVSDYEGEFFISTNFTSCCNSGANDGTITLSVENNMIVDFEWIDVIPNCNGTFIGTGQIMSNGDVELSITGHDCDGNHVAVITLKKQ
jgi:hypothetical protein